MNEQPFLKDTLAHACQTYGWEIGDYTYADRPVIVGAGQGGLKIGRFVSIAGGLRIFLGMEHRVDWVSTYPFMSWPSRWPEAAAACGHAASKGDVEIGNDVWIASDVTILSGTRIGDGAVLCTGAVVSRDVPPYAVVGGVPATVRRYRFTVEQVEALLRKRWWSWPAERIRAAIPLLLSPNIQAFIDWADQAADLALAAKVPPTEHA